MPIKHAIWKVGPQPAPLAATRLANEQLLEDMIVREPRGNEGSGAPPFASFV